MHEKLVTFEDAPEGLVIKQTQVIPDEWLQANRLERANSISTPAGELHKVASIPEAYVDKWGMEYVMKAPVADILKRLRKEQLDDFITSNKV